MNLHKGGGGGGFCLRIVLQVGDDVLQLLNVVMHLLLPVTPFRCRSLGPLHPCLHNRLPFTPISSVKWCDPMRS